MPQIRQRCTSIFYRSILLASQIITLQTGALKVSRFEKIPLRDILQIIFCKVQQLSVTFLSRNGEIEALLTYERNHGLCSKYRDASANDDRCRRGIVDISLRRLLLRLSYRHHGTLGRLQSSVALREKLCIPRVRGCTLLANGLWNFTRHVPFLHFIAASIHEYAKLTQVLGSWNIWDADNIRHIIKLIIINTLSIYKRYICIIIYIK